MSEIEKLLSEDWADKKLSEVFEVEKFKALGKENDSVFQALTFLGEASQKVSVARTILMADNEVNSDKEMFEQFDDIQRMLHELTKYVRTGW